MKKLIYAGLAVLLAFSFAACGSATGGPYETNGNDTQGAVTYGYDANKKITSVTLSLDGKGSRSAARAISKPIADEAMNYYEVAFCDNTNVARASWSFGETVSITGVPRGTAAAGIDYSRTGGGTLSAALGNAILFVGRKSTEGGPTLLAIGKVIAVDGISGDTTVYPASKSVTFGLSAFTGDGGTSFVGGTGAGSDTTLTVGAYSLTVHKFSPATACTATYTLVSSAGTIFPIVDMLAGVDITATSTYDKFSTKQPVLNNAMLTSYKGPIIEDTPARTAILNKSTGAINITFTTKSAVIASGGNVGLVSCYFSIPVRAISGIAGVGTPAVPANTWFIRPGIDLGEVDYGANSIGAGILVTNGDPYTDGLLIIVGGAL